MDDDGLSGPIGSHSKSSQRPADRIPKAGTKSLLTPGVGKLNAPVAKASSLAALHARRQAQNPGARSQAPPSASTTATHSASGKAVLQLRSNNAQIPTSASAGEKPSEQPATRGKLQPAKRGIFAQTPVDQAAAAKPSKGRRNALDEVGSEGSEILVQKQNVSNRKEKAPTTKAPVKAPERTQAPRAAKRGTIYELSESPETEEPTRPTKQPRATKTTPSRKPVESGAKPASSRRTRQPAEPASRSVAKAKPKQLQKERESINPNSARTRMRSQSDSRPPNTAAESSARKDQATFSKHDESKKKGRDFVPREERAEKIRKRFQTTVEEHNDDSRNKSEFEVVANQRPPSQYTESKTAAVEKAKPSGRKSNEEAYVREQTAYEEQGTSEQDAIVLSDRQVSSPFRKTLPPQYEENLPLAPADETDEQAKSKGQAPKTPKTFPSSPPVAAGQMTRRSPAGLVDAGAVKKTAIVAFDKSGPRNQGSLLVKNHVPESVTLNRISLPQAAPPQASSASSLARLEARPGNGPSSATTSMKSYRAKRHAPPPNVAGNVADALDAFKNKPAHAPVGKAMIELSPVKGIPQHELTANASERPHEDDADYLNIDDFEGTTLVNGEQPAEHRAEPISIVKSTNSQAAMPPPAFKASELEKPHRAPTVPAMVESGPSASPLKRTQTAATRPVVKRTAQVEPIEEPAPKRMRTASVVEEEPARVPERPYPTEATLNVQRNSALSQQGIKHHAAPVKRASRKPSRQISQGSQKVDISGSPVPQGMVLQGDATALETYSQQANLSSDAVLGNIVITRNSTRLPNVAQTRAHVEQNLQPRELGVLHSNAKPVPTVPDEQSKSSITIVRTDPKQPLVKDQIKVPLNDPFTSSEEARKRPRQGSSSSTLLNQLGRKASKQANAPKPVRLQDEDPDKTLVEPEEQIRPQQRKASMSTDSSSESSEDSDETTDTMRNIGIWREALQPHQLNLFDELIIVSHMLVRHLVDRETAATDIVDDYRRRGLHIVEQMELDHARQYQEYVKALNERKKRLRKDLSECSRTLKESVGAVVTAQRERSERATQHESFAEELQTIMERYC